MPFDSRISKATNFTSGVRLTSCSRGTIASFPWSKAAAAWIIIRLPVMTLGMRKVITSQPHGLFNDAFSDQSYVASSDDLELMCKEGVVNLLSRNLPGPEDGSNMFLPKHLSPTIRCYTSENRAFQEINYCVCPP
jgi:hypothetical protein